MKVHLGPWCADIGLPNSISDLKDKVSSALHLPDNSFKMFFEDNEGEAIALSEDEDLEDAQSYCQEKQLNQLQCQV